MKIVAFIVVLLLPVSSIAHNFVILPETEFIKVQDLCSRSNVEASSGWKLTPESIKAVEEDIKKLDELSAYGKKHVFSSYFKQYLGIILNGKKYIYVNALNHKRMSWLAPEFVDLCGGGFKSFRAVYDPRSREFTDLAGGGL